MCTTAGMVLTLTVDQGSATVDRTKIMTCSPTRPPHWVVVLANSHCEIGRKKREKKRGKISLKDDAVFGN
jgi:hypothetical protein